MIRLEKLQSIQRNCRFKIRRKKKIYMLIIQNKILISLQKVYNLHILQILMKLNKQKILESVYLVILRHSQGPVPMKVELNVTDVQ